MINQDKFYYDKYLKYKQKYLLLKQKLGGGPKKTTIVPSDQGTLQQLFTKAKEILLDVKSFTQLNDNTRLLLDNYSDFCFNIDIELSAQIISQISPIKIPIVLSYGFELENGEINVMNIVTISGDSFLQPLRVIDNEVVVVRKPELELKITGDTVSGIGNELIQYIRTNKIMKITINGISTQDFSLLDDIWTEYINRCLPPEGLITAQLNYLDYVEFIFTKFEYCDYFYNIFTEYRIIVNSLNGLIRRNLIQTTNFNIVECDNSFKILPRYKAFIANSSVNPNPFEKIILISEKNILDEATPLQFGTQLTVTVTLDSIRNLFLYLIYKFPEEYKREKKCVDTANFLLDIIGPDIYAENLLLREWLFLKLYYIIDEQIMLGIKINYILQRIPIIHIGNLSRVSMSTRRRYNMLTKFEKRIDLINELKTSLTQYDFSNRRNIRPFVQSFNETFQFINEEDYIRLVTSYHELWDSNQLTELSTKVHPHRLLWCPFTNSYLNLSDANIGLSSVNTIHEKDNKLQLRHSLKEMLYEILLNNSISINTFLDPLIEKLNQLLLPTRLWSPINKSVLIALKHDLQLYRFIDGIDNLAVQNNIDIIYEVNYGVKVSYPQTKYRVRSFDFTPETSMSASKVFVEIRNFGGRDNIGIQAAFNGLDPASKILAPIISPSPPQPTQSRPKRRALDDDSDDDA